jgi:hypothetical protein
MVGTGFIVSGWDGLRRMAVRLPIYLADTVADPRWFLMFVFGRFGAARDVAARLLRMAGPQHFAGCTVFGGVDPDRVIADLERDGLSREIRLPAEIVETVRGFASATPCYAGLDRGLSFHPDEHAEAERRLGRAILVGHYLERVEDCEAIGALGRDPTLHRIAAGYLGTASPFLIATRLWWSFPTRKAREIDLHQASQERFHFDLDDWRQLKFFFYLTDVDAEAGPHVYVRGSHRRHALPHQFTPFVGKSAEAVTRHYGRDRITTLTGPAGSGFAEDPFGFHTGTLALRRSRLMLELSFGITDVLARRRHGDVGAARNRPGHPAVPLSGPVGGPA